MHMRMHMHMQMHMHMHMRMHMHMQMHMHMYMRMHMHMHMHGPRACTAARSQAKRPTSSALGCAGRASRCARRSASALG